MGNSIKYVVSACLAGCHCRYDGQSNTNSTVQQLIQEGRALPLCPEQLGGLPTPRPPFELKGDSAVSQEGDNVTDPIVHGVQEAMQLIRLAGCTAAILKSRSPSCGAGRIYDGTFSGKLIDGDGLFAKACRAAGLEVTTADAD